MSGAQTVDGRDLSVDGAKLDNIEANATADQTASEILTAIKTVDGTGSGLDADLLDGQHASAFLTAHPAVSAASSSDNSGRTYIQDITLDTYGHVTGIATATETVVNTDTNTTDWRVANSAGTEQFAVSAAEQVRFAASGAASVAFNSSTQTITFSSTDTNTDTNTTYALTAAQTGGTDANPNLFLNASSGTDYNVQLVGSGATTVTRNSDGQITISSTDTNTDTTNFNIQANSGTQVNISAGEEINFINGNATTAVVTNQTNPTVTFNHNDTSSQASVNNSNGTVIQDVTLDGYGHVTGLASANLDDRYYTETEADSRFVNVTGDTMSGVLTFSGSSTHIAMQEDHYVFRRIDVVDEAVLNSSTAYVLLCANAANNDVNGTITMDRTSGLRHASSCDVLVSAGNATTPVGTCRSMSTAGGGAPTYELVTLTYSSTSYVALKITNPDNYYETSGAYFTGRVSTTAGTNELIFVAPANVSSVAAFGSNESHQINGDAVFHDGYHPNADKWTTGRTIALTGDVTGTSGSFDGSANLSFSTAIASGVVGANELNVTGNGTTAQFLRSDGDGSFTWATPTDTNTTSLPIENSAGTAQFTATDTTGLQFAGSGATSVAFDATNRRVTISSTDTDTNTTYSAGTGISLSGTTFSHADTSSQASLTALTGANVVSDIDVDGFGHVTNLATRTMTLGDLGYTGETNATADQTASEILTAIKTVDGAGSGLDADTLDGVQGSNFLRSNVSDTASGRMTFTSGLVLSGNAGDANSSQLIISDIAPQIKLLDTDTTHDDFWIHVDSNNFYVLADRNESDTWATPHPMQLEADTNIGYMFGSRVFTDSYHPNADVWTTGRTIALTGDVTGTSGSFNGSSNLSFSTNIAANVVGANELNVSGNGTTAQFLRSDGDGTFTWATPTDTNTTYSAGSGISLSGTTFSHSDTSSQASVNNSGNTFIQDITVDTYGHITALTSATATASANDDIFWENGQTVSSNYTITNGKNAMSAGPITIGSGVTVTVGDGETWTVV